MEKVQKPLILEIEEAKQETLSMVNEIMKRHGLPCYIYQNIIEDIHRQVTAGARNEIGTVSEEYASKCKEIEKKENEKKEQKS